MARDEDSLAPPRHRIRGRGSADYSARFAKTAEDARESAPQWPTAGLADRWRTASGQSTQ